MTPREIQLIRSTFGQIYRRPEAAGTAFYSRLFEIAPDTRRLFSADIEPQAKKLMDTLNVAVSTLRDTPSLTAILHRMGRSHVAYGVTPAHYDQVGEALLWTIDRALDGGLTDEALKAWTKLYGTVAAAMQAGAAMPPDRVSARPRSAATPPAP